MLKTLSRYVSILLELCAVANSHLMHSIIEHFQVGFWKLVLLVFPSQSIQTIILVFLCQSNETIIVMLAEVVYSFIVRIELDATFEILFLLLHLLNRFEAHVRELRNIQQRGRELLQRQVTSRHVPLPGYHILEVIHSLYHYSRPSIKGSFKRPAP